MHCLKNTAFIVALGLCLGLSTTQVAAQDGTSIFVVGGKADDPYWSRVKMGVEDASLLVEEQGGSVTWLGPQNYDNLGPDAADLIRTAISQGADAIIASNWVPEAQDDAFRAAVEAGVLVILYGAGGIESANSLGAMNYIGSDEYLSAVDAATYINGHGSSNILCVNTLPGLAVIESRCKGLADGMAAVGGTSTELPLPASAHGNATAVAEAVKATLLTDDTIDGVITVSGADATSAATAIMQAGAGERVRLGTFDLDDSSAERIASGEQLFSIDAQQYLYGYLSVFLANAYLNHGFIMPQRPILTGSAIVDASNLEATLAGVAAGTR